MANKYLSRDDAPFGESVWEALDDVVVAAAKSQLSARRILDIEGPYGLEQKSIPLYDITISDEEVKLMSSPVLPIPLMETQFTLNTRDLAAYEAEGIPLNTQNVAMAAIALARAEDALIFEGDKKLGLEGLLTTKGARSVELGNWDQVGTAADVVIKGVSALDAAGFHGPYALALAPDLYNKLYRLYPQGYQIELQHIEGILGSKVVKAPGIGKGGALLATGSQFASIVIGQDMMTGFIGPDNSDFKFRITESLVLRLRVPESVCVLK